MTTYYSTAIDYNRFMESFKRVYPELFEKYSANISLPPKGSCRVCIHNTPGLRHTTRKILNFIINEYYRPLSN